MELLESSTTNYTAGPRSDRYRDDDRDRDDRRRSDLKRKYSVEDDRDRDRERDSKHRRSESGLNRSDPAIDSQQLSLLKLVFTPMKDSFRRVAGATKEKIKSQKERANILKHELLVIGNFIDTLKGGDDRDENMDALIPSFW